MPTFKVLLQQYVEKTATVEIEAETPERAIELAKNNAASATWEDGDDAYSVSAYAVLDPATNEAVWER